MRHDLMFAAHGIAYGDVFPNYRILCDQINAALYFRWIGMSHREMFLNGFISLLAP